uniref:DUF4219 domain-containing protein/UBN2 domain-containing protein n=1 Tax=Tanacetum cinerariifolium TaxID=118510 RepID=A0A6L2N056_TANCI|nr:hypothetical protein [Tanacetum cinerariifolium]
MSRDVLTVGSTMRIPLLYRGEYSQWVERFMNYLKEQTDGEAMINSIKNRNQPLPRVTQVSIAGTSSTEQPPFKDKSMWFDQEKRIQKINRLARSLLIQGPSNDIYSLIDSNKTAKDLWDALARHMLGSEYGEQDRKDAVLYEYETFKATEGELLLDTYIRYLQVINDLKKCGYSKDNKMSRDVLTVGSTMRILLLYRGEYSQWVERFMNYLEEQTDKEAMINCIKNGDQPLHRVTQVSIAGTSSTEQPSLKDKSIWSDQEKKIQKIDRLARSLMIQGLPNDIYSLIDSNKTANSYGMLLLDICLVLNMVNKIEKLQFCMKWKQYATMIRQNKNLMDNNIDALYNTLKQNQGDVNDAIVLKKKTIMVTSDPLALIAKKIEVLLKLILPVHRIRRWRYNLTLAESKFKDPHARSLRLSRPVTPRSINHEKYTLVIVDEYSRGTITLSWKPCNEAQEKDEAETTQESSLKRTGNDLEQERSKKQKMEDDKESAELKTCLEIVPDDGDDVTIDAIPLSSKSSTIVDYKIYKEGKKNNF